MIRGIKQHLWLGNWDQFIFATGVIDLFSVIGKKAAGKSLLQ